MRGKLKMTLAPEACVGALAILVFTFAGLTPISERSFARLRAGLTERQVERILGQPGDYAQPGRSTLHSCNSTWGRHGDKMKTWVANDACIFISFDEQNLVMGATMLTPPPPLESNFDRFLRAFFGIDRRVRE